MLKRAQEIAEIIKDTSGKIHVVSHIDADGITAGSIAYKTLSRMNKDFSIEFVKQLDDKVLKKLKDEKHDMVWFTDLGSSVSNNSPEIDKIITDHHVCPPDSDFCFHLNPHLFDIDGSTDISGAGVTYLVSKSIDKKNLDLSPLAIIGACGDLQDKKTGRLTGLNQEILKDGKKIDLINSEIDISFFGRETRPIFKLLQYSNDPVIPGLTGNENACINFIKKQDVKLKDEGKWRKWIDLDKDEKRKITSALASLLLNKGFGHKLTKRIIGEVYTLQKEKKGTSLHDVKEYATLLNSTARYGKFNVGLQVCLGDRDKFLKKALNLLRGHRQNLVKGMQFAKEEGIFRRENLQYFHAKSGIRDTIIGIVTNMLLNSNDTENNLPLLGFAYKTDETVKVSARATRSLIEKGLDLSVALNKAAEKLDGAGGGHNIAAGATIPKGKEEKFLDILEKEFRKQLN